MFERYTEGTRRVIFFARFEASAFGKSEIETEHLLLGILREGFKASRSLLPSMPAKLEDVRRNAATKSPADALSIESPNMPLSEESKRVLSYAAEEADKLKDKQIRVEHMAIGLMREAGSVGAQLLQDYGATIESFRDSLRKAGGYTWASVLDEIFCPKCSPTQWASPVVTADGSLRCRACGSRLGRYLPPE